MLHDVIRCYADALYLKTTLRLPPRPVAGEPALPAAGGSTRYRRRKRLLRVGQHLAAALSRHLDRTGTASALAGKRSFRRIGG